MTPHTVALVATVLASMLGLTGAQCRSASPPAASATATATTSATTESPQSYVFREIQGQPLRAFVFAPPTQRGQADRGAILLFHGGGWVAGQADWTFPAARRFADAGLVAIAVEYRLSGETLTPIDALDDVCAAFAWARKESSRLGFGGGVAGYGVSAGGQLVAASATVGCAGDAPARPIGPDALLLWSPALDVARDGWFVRILQGRAAAEDYSPVEHVRPSTPPTSIVHGERDTLTPLAGSRRYCDRLQELGGKCDLHVYPAVGHLLTRNLASQESDFDPDPAAMADGIARHLEFLRTLGLAPSR